METRRTTTHLGTFEVDLVDGRPVRSRALAGDEGSAGVADGLHEVLDHDLRIRRPHVRKGWLERGPRHRDNRRGAEPFVPVEWDEVYDLISGELTRVRRTHGDAAVFGGSYGWSSAGRFHHAQSQIHRFLAVDGGYTSSRNSYSVGAQEVVLPHVIGGNGMAMFDWNPSWREIAEHAQVVLAFGGAPLKNTQVNQGGLLRHGAGRAQRACAEAGVRFHCISPVREDLDEGLDARWVPIRPGTDTALMLAMAHHIADRNLEDRDFLERCCTGYPVLRDYLMGRIDGTVKSASWAEGITGVPAATITGLAEELAAHRSVVSVTWSIQRAQHGEQPYWAAVALAAMSGSMGRPGGGFAAGLSATHGIGINRGSLGAASLPQPPNPVPDFIPVARIADMLAGPGDVIDYDGIRIEYPDVRLVYWAGGNPFHHHQDLNKLLRAWNVPETVVVHDSWWTPIARHADIVVPVATTFERDDIAAGGRDDMLLPMRRVVDPPDGVPTDFEAFREVARRRDLRGAFDEGLDARDWLLRLYGSTAERAAARGITLPPFEEFWSGEGIQLPPEPRDWRVFDDLRRDPEAHRLGTPSGRIEIFSATVAGFGYDECPGYPVWLPPAEDIGDPHADPDAFHLLSHQPKGKLHSQLDFARSSMSHKSDGRERVSLHPRAAARLGIADGDVVRVFNDRGACLAVARTDDGIHERVALMATGGWWDPEIPGEPGATCLQGNPNVLTPDIPTSRLAQASSAQTCVVSIRPEPDAPATRAHIAPHIAPRTVPRDAS
ncbi:molybdopterin-dependent oxidoreductase [Nocardioides sp. QY071]|uniref:molybdopterin-dependent oxidoreductase n=1 Tax=Nocardioides sp. QY071 TaxID=3044187 RepID=UPI00249B1CA6|nr:molybdopterin-dependent oxidoreductase [Nocardioides sp. QY071]WGY02893.1 molybdopterin-dependent oxidoreductase [Nocardioides sp. QY071]